MLTGDGTDYAQLKRVAEALRQRLLKVPSVIKVNLYGVQDERIYVEFSHAKLATLGIPPQAIFESLRSRTRSVPPARSRRARSAFRCVSRARWRGSERSPRRPSRRTAACSGSPTSRR
jgi:multidrug efflux pump subunit AcrB